MLNSYFILYIPSATGNEITKMGIEIERYTPLTPIRVTDKLKHNLGDSKRLSVSAILWLSANSHCSQKLELSTRQVKILEDITEKTHRTSAKIRNTLRAVQEIRNI